MALNKFMHPRNVYKTPPNFSKLYKQFEEFSRVAKMDVTGKVSIDFKDPQALRVLTKCLLKSDFELDVIIPEDRLVPTLPLRLNYILWIEDLLNLICKEDIVTGLDIGTGACAIYPLLAAVKYKWYMVGIEKDEESLHIAEENVKRNCLQHLIKLRNNTSTTLIEHLFKADDGLKFHFCMCNPPFYSNVQDLWESRSPARPPPKNGFTGSPQELITEGGELEFCRKLIKESITYKNNILIFTTMIGHKYNLKELLIDLKADGIKHTTTEFCQGRVTRWGLAWTFQNYDIHSLVPPRDKLRKKNTPISCILPELSNHCHDIQNVTEKIKIIFDILEIKYKIINKSRNGSVLNFTASKNTWSNQRRKRRLLKKIEDTSTTKKQKLADKNENNEIIESTDKNVLSSMTQEDTKISTNLITATEDNSPMNQVHTKISTNLITATENNSPMNQEHTKISTNLITATENNSPMNQEHNKESTNLFTATENNSSMNQEHTKESTNLFTATENNLENDEGTCSQISENSITKTENEKQFLEGIIKVINKDGKIVLDMKYLHGSYGKEGIHQILQYIKNNWK